MKNHNELFTEYFGLIMQGLASRDDISLNYETLIWASKLANDMVSITLETYKNDK